MRLTIHDWSVTSQELRTGGVDGGDEIAHDPLVVTVTLPRVVLEVKVLHTSPVTLYNTTVFTYLDLVPIFKGRKEHTWQISQVVAVQGEYFQ